MAFVDYELDMGGFAGVLPFIYNVSFSVGGGGCYNFREDVLLVQYLLKKIVERSPGPPPTGREMKVDGLMGDTTRRWIQAFQSGAFLVVPSDSIMGHDGRVDRAHGNRYAPKTGRIWTIVHLNFTFKQRCPELYFSLQSAPDLPGLLMYGLIVHPGPPPYTEFTD